MGQFCCRLCSYFCPGGAGQQGPSQQSVPSQQAAPDFNQILAKPGLAKADLISIRDSIKQTVSTLKHSTGSSSSCGNNMSANANDLFQAAPGFLNAISEEAGRAQGGLQLLDQIDDVMGLKILTEILKAFGALHWVASSLSLVAYLLKIKVCRNENKKEAMELLDEMVDLASELVGKYEHFSPDNETFKKAIGTIIDGAISCCDVIPGSLARFITADSDANLLINIRQKMKSIKMDIISQCEEEILNRIPKPYQSYEPGQASRKDSAISGDKRVEKIMALLSVGSSTPPPRALIIHGIGGIGKTTLLDKVCSTLLDPHYGRSFKHVKISLPIEDSNPINHWQQVLYETLTTKAMKFADEKQGQFEILRELKKLSKPVLLSIDNASDESQLNMLLPEELDQIPSGSLILITTRNVGVKNKLKDKGIQEVKEYPVERLSAEDSRNILEKMIGEHILKKIDEKDFASLLKGCDGHPLALTIAGKFIRYEVEDGVPLQEDAVSPQEACKYVLESFENHPEDEGDRIGGKELFKALDYSINHLPDDSKTAFFDIVVFFNMSDEFTWDEVKAIYDPIPFKRLKDRSLIQKKDNKVQVHDLLCSQARCQMAKCATRIKGWKELEPLNHQQGIELVEGLDFGHKSDKLGQNLNENIFKAKLKQMTRLRLLLNSPPLQDMYPQELLQAFSGYELNKFPFSNTDSLRSLNIYASPKLDLIKLFSRQPRSKFPTLRHLRLSECKTSSMALPEKGIAELKSLKTLQIKLCKKLTKLPQDLWSLTSLQKLDLSRCESLEAIPPIKGRGQSCSIQTILLSGCVQLKTLPEDLWSLTSLQHLNLLRCKSLKELPPFKGMGHSCSIQILDLLECTGLKTLPGDLWSLTSLQHLDLRDCQSLVALPPIKGMGQSCSIRTLNLSSCIKLKTLIEDLWSLTSLQHLNLTGCENLKALPLIKGMGKFCCIQKIRGSECTGLKTLPEDLWNLTSLQHLNLAGCESLEALPPIKGLTQSCCIQVLNLSKCTALKTLPEDLWSLTSLQKLDLSHCESLKSLPLIKGMGKSCCIQTIRLSGCRALETLPENLQSLTSLRELHLEDCSELVLNGTSQWASANIVVFKH